MRDSSPVQWSYKELSPLALAYIGDAVWEMYARNHVLAGGVRKPNDLHRTTTKYVRAKAQAELADWLRDKLSEDEQDMLRRGRNANSGHTRKNTEVLTYRHSTGFETLIGYLYGSGQWDRLEQLCKASLRWIDDGKDELDGENE